MKSGFSGEECLAWHGDGILPHRPHLFDYEIIRYYSVALKKNMKKKEQMFD